MHKLRKVGRAVLKVVTTLCLIWLGLLTLLLVTWQTLPWWSPTVMPWARDTFNLPLYFDKADTTWRGSRVALELDGLTLGDQFRAKKLVLELNVAASVWRFYPVMNRIQLRDADIHLDPQASSSDSTFLWHSWWVTLPVDASGTLTIDAPQQPRSYQWSLYNAPLEGRSFHYRGQVTLAAKEEPPLVMRWEGSPIRGKGWIQLPEAEWRDEIAAWLPEPQTLTQFQAGAELWFDWRRNTIRSVSGHLSLPVVEVNDRDNHFKIREVTSDLRWRGNLSDWQGSLQKLSWRVDAAGRRLPPMNLVTHWANQRQTLWLDTLDLRPFWRWLQVQQVDNELWNNRLVPLSARGLIRHLRMDIPWGHPKDWQLRADLQHVATADVSGIPALIDVTGGLLANAGGGSVSLNGQPLSLAFPDLYRNGWEFNSAEGAVRWHIGEQQVTVSGKKLGLSRLGWQAHGQFKLTLPMHEDDGPPAHFYLAIGARHSEVAQGLDFVPTYGLPESLSQWLESTGMTGDLNRASFLYDGSVEADAGWNERTVQLYVDADRARLKVSPDWPEVSTDHLSLLVKDENIAASIGATHIGGLDASAATVAWDNQAKDRRLHINAQASDDLEDLVGFFKQSPLASSTAALSDWQIKGRLSGPANIAIPLESDAGKLAVDVKAKVSQAQISNAARNLTISHLNGTLKYDLVHGMSSEGSLKGKWLGNTVTGTIEPGSAKKASVLTLNGHSTLESLAKWRGFSLPAWAQGELDWQASHGLCDTSEESCPALSLSSPLKGVSIDLPPPLGKQAGSVAPLTVTIQEGDLTRVEAAYRDQLFAKALLKAGSLQALTATLGSVPPKWPKPDAVDISINIPRLRPDVWIAAAKDFQQPVGSSGKSTSADSGSSPKTASSMSWLDTLSVRIATQHLDWLGRDWGAMSLGFDPQGVLLNGDNLQGRVKLSPNHQHVSLALERLWIPKAQSADTESQLATAQTAEQDALKDVDTSSWPQISGQIADVRFENWPLGAWKFRGSPVESGADFILDEARLDKNVISGSLRWRKAPESSSHLSLAGQGKDIGEIIKAAGYQKSISSDDWKATLDVGWPGSPAAFSLAQLDGNANVSMKDGEILKASTESNALKIFNIFNFTQIGKRLTLDFSDLFSSGVSYDTWESPVDIKKGVLSSAKPTRIKGGGADITAQGTLNLATEEIDQHIEVTLPLTSTLPIAALLAGVPQVGGALFLIDKLTGDKLSKIASIRYHVTGKLGEEKIEAEGRKDSGAVKQPDKSDPNYDRGSK
ncbi:YhdP family protein [Pokkaliibacter sp. CJK22405]|uniref:YhdP family phospholipid transporter n=1 Tax=Pokkaliibacter sp. CJK22405 TaxID=3384615 RepID=UPI003984E9BC